MHRKNSRSILQAPLRGSRIMGNADSSGFTSSEPQIRESPTRPLRSILRQTSNDPDNQRRSVVFADQPDSLPGQHVRFTYQPFNGLSDSTQRVTHLGHEIQEECEEDLEANGQEELSLEVLQNPSEMPRHRKKRAPAPPTRRDSIKGSFAPPPPPHRDSVSPVRHQSLQTNPNFEELRNRLRQDLQQSRKEYERLKNLRQPLDSRRKDDVKYVDRIYHHLRMSRDNTDDKTVTPASSTETLKGASAGPRRDGLKVIDMRRFKDLDHEEDASNKWIQDTKRVLEDLDLDGQRQMNGSSRAPALRRHFMVGADRQWSCQSSDSGISNTLPPDLDEQGSSAPPCSMSSTSSLMSVPMQMSPPPVPLHASTQSIPAKVRLRSEADMVPTFRLPNPSAHSPNFASSEPLFAFDDRPASELGDTRRSHRRMNDSFRRMRSSIGRVFGSINKMSGSASLKRRPVSIANFDSPADVYYSQHGPLEAWQVTGSVYDLTEAEIVKNQRRRPRSMLDEHFDSVWHDVVRTSHEQLRLSNPSFFEEPSIKGSREVLSMSTNQTRTTGRYVKQTRAPYKSGTIR